MSNRYGTFLGLCARHAWKEASALLLPSSWKVGIRNVAVLLATLVMMLFAQGPLTQRALIPAGQNEAIRKLIATGYGLAALLVIFLVYLLAELVLIAPYRLWAELQPKSEASPLIDDETKRLAGVVGALRERVMRYGFTIPVMADDPFFGLWGELDGSTHPVWLKQEVLQARRDFLHACGALADANAHHEDRKEIEHWRGEIDRSSAELIRFLFPALS